jgi:hypothetical protein
MSEDEFWMQLRFRIMWSGGLTGRLSGYCDWFNAKHYFLDGVYPRITGEVGFLRGREVIELPFTLFLGREVDSLETIEWADFLPPEGTTGWILDRENHIEIYPSWAVNPPIVPADPPADSN